MTTNKLAKFKKALFLYKALPKHFREKIRDFLPPSLQGHLSLSAEEISANEIKSISRQIRDRALKPARHFWFIAYGWLLLNFAWAVTALVSGHPVAAASCLIYALVGFLYFSNKSLTYLKLRFFPKPFSLSTALLAFGAFLVIMPLTGFLTLDEEIAHSSVSSLLPILVQGMLLAPVFEEILFRDIFYTFGKEIYGNDLFSILFTAFLFGVIHLQSTNDITGYSVYFLAGIVLGGLRYLSKGIFYSILVHSAVNTSLFFI